MGNSNVLIPGWDVIPAVFGTNHLRFVNSEVNKIWRKEQPGLDRMFHILGDSWGIKKALPASNVASDISGRGAAGWSSASLSMPGQKGLGESKQTGR